MSFHIVGVFGDRQGVVKHIRDTVIYHLHIHKAGGTSICLLAGRNGMITSPDNVCNGLPDQSCCGSYPEAFLRAHPYTFVANERAMPKFRHDLFRYMTVIREPIARSLSHYRHVHESKTFDEPAYEVWAMHQPDNWYVRHICGDDCMHVPRGKLGMVQLNVALQRLQQFDHVYILEKLNDDGFSRMGRDLGWTGHMHTRVRSNNDASVLSEACRARLEHIFRLDAVLYHWALARYANDNYQPQCTNACCGKCSTH